MLMHSKACENRTHINHLLYKEDVRVYRSNTLPFVHH